MLTALAIVSFGLSGARRIIPFPEPKANASPSGEFVAMTARRPPEKGRPTDGMILRMGRVSSEATVALLWTTRLDYWPALILASDDGHVATVGSWYEMGGHEAVTLFDDAGLVIGDYPISSFATPTEKAFLPRISFNIVPSLIVGARFERARGARATRLGQPSKLRPFRLNSPSEWPPSVLAVSLKGGRTVYFDPVDGKLLPSTGDKS